MTAGLAGAVLTATLMTQALAQSPAARADSLQTAARPWHAAEAWRRAVAREPSPTVGMLVAGARAQLDARRFDRARSLLVGQAWLADRPDGLAALGNAELALGLHRSAADRFFVARGRASGAQAALLAVREAVALEAAGLRESARASWRTARQLGLAAIADWLQLREARVTGDTAAARALLNALGAGPARLAPRAWAEILLDAGDSAAAQVAYARLGLRREAVHLALLRGDTSGARAVLYDRGDGVLSRDDATTMRALAVGLPPQTANEFVQLARAHRAVAARGAAVGAARRARALGDSSGPTLLLLGDALADDGQLWAAERSYRAATRDPAVTALATYRRARILARIGDAGAVRALAGFADSYPGDTAAPTALYFLADYLGDRHRPDADRWYAELIRRYPDERVASLARFRLADAMQRANRLDSAAALYRDEVRRAAQQARAASFALGRVALAQGDSASAHRVWAALAAEDSLGYYGLRARALAALPPLVIGPGGAGPAPPAVEAALARIDTLRLAGLDSEAVAEVRALVAAPPDQLDALVALSEGLTARGHGPAGVQLGWIARGRAPGDARALRAVFPWPNRRAVTAEAEEFGVDPLLFAALVRQESVFDAGAQSRSGARGLAQLLPATAAEVARRLDVALEPEWLVVPDLNLHLGAAHFAHLVRHFDGRLDAAIAAYNAGATPVRRWLGRPGMGDPDAFVELIPYRETRGYLRAVQRNRWLYAALYPTAVE